MDINNLVTLAILAGCIVAALILLRVANIFRYIANKSGRDRGEDVGGELWTMCKPHTIFTTLAATPPRTSTRTRTSMRSMIVW